MLEGRGRTSVGGHEYRLVRVRCREESNTMDEWHAIDAGTLLTMNQAENMTVMRTSKLVSQEAYSDNEV